MRKYNFPVRAVQADASEPLFRLVLDPRFSAAEMLADFPRNVVQPFLNVVLADGKQGSCFKAAGSHAIEVSLPSHIQVNDAERAILANLMDFGQDFESARSTTIGELVFFLTRPDENGPESFLDALAARNAEAVAFMNEVMLQFPPEDEYSTRTWPEELIERYYFGIVLEYGDLLDNKDMSAALGILDCLHDVNMWTGFSVKANPGDTMKAGGSGISFEIEAENGAISYQVERPACDPALSILILVEKIEKLTGARPRAWQIHIEAAG
ncbi:hypothetical protein IT41_19410 [Paracoccus halophilus]|nr:hypothetical protein [Paracoccus halophilus]KGJ01720.1 hypothetical protein IT41_19410 [Paracoccus halophilus]